MPEPSVDARVAEPTMNGAESLVRTLIASGVDLCFANPGTSEMHLVAALDRVEGMRCVLGLFEGVCTGAADGYYRLAGRPAATLLHLGPGLANGLANLHNAKKARSGVVNLVGDHARVHLTHDAPLTADVAAVARPMSDWVRSAESPATLPADAAAAIEAARTPPGRIATLIVPADAAWGTGGPVAAARPPRARSEVDAATIREAADLIRGGDAALLLGGAGVLAPALLAAGRIAAKTGCTLLAEFNSPRTERGAGRVVARRVPYVVDAALAMLAPYRRVVLAGAAPPVAFFSYPGKPSLLARPDCRFVRLASVETDIGAALAALADALGASTTRPAQVAARAEPVRADGPLGLDGVARVLAARLPEGAIVVDEAISSGREFGPLTEGAAPHDWLTSMGGSIGYGLPVAVGAALAAPGRRVVALEGDGSAMYTPQALWTMARESLDITVIVFANRAYRILRGEFDAVGAGSPGRRATDMLTLDRPPLDWVALARGMGVAAQSVQTLGQFAAAFAGALAEPGPQLIELAL